MKRLGKTNIYSPKNGFGALPIQRISMDGAARILLRAFKAGITFYDTARFYTDSEAKIAYALSDYRKNIYIASKTMAQDRDSFLRDLEGSLRALNSDYIDLYQFHNPSFCPKPGDSRGLYEEMIKAKENGLIRHIGISNHRLSVANEAIDSGLYETLQFPFSYLASQKDFDLVNKCLDKGMGFIAMKALAGGLISNAEAAFSFMSQHDVLPIWGIQKMEELEEFIALEENPPAYDKYKAFIEKDRQDLGKDFCRGCGYCMPCPEGIDIANVARMSLMLKRAPKDVYLTAEWKARVLNGQNCTECNQCASLCPYELDTPRLIRENVEDYKSYL